MTLPDIINQDVGDVFLADYAVAVTIAGAAATAIPLTDFANADPRAPVLRVATAAIDGVSQGAAVVYDGANYYIEFIRPGRYGLHDIGLRASD